MAVDLTRIGGTRAWSAEGGKASGRKTPGVAMIPCTPRQLEVFLAAAEDCHFVSTAHRLGISQAAVSSHIAALEQQLGVPLFIRRRGRKPVLSNVGLALLGEARSYSSEAVGSRGGRTRSPNPALKSVRVGAGGHLLDDCIKQRLPEFYLQHKGIEIECQYAESPSGCVQLVKEGELDILVYTVPNPALIPLHVEILKSVELALYAGVEYSAQLSASPAELSAMPFILPPEGTSGCALIRSALATAGIECRNVAARAQFSSVGKDMARQGGGVVALFDTMVSPEDAPTLLKFRVELPTMYRCLFRRLDASDDAIASVESFLRDILTS